jgi:hypothetical protein
VERGTVPEGDDPNDILTRDFRVRSVYGAKGQEAWRRYRDLRIQSRAEPDPARKAALVAEYLRLGREYNFPAGGEETGDQG